MMTLAITWVLGVGAAADLPPYAGKLAIDPTPVGAEISVDGVRCESTPCVIDVSAGNHEITVSKPGYGTRTVFARVTADAWEHVHVALYPDLTTEQRERAAKNARIAAWTTLGVSAASAVSAVLVNFLAYEPARRASSVSPSHAYDVQRWHRRGCHRGDIFGSLCFRPTARESTRWRSTPEPRGRGADRGAGARRSPSGLRDELLRELCLQFRAREPQRRGGFFFVLIHECEHTGDVAFFERCRGSAEVKVFAWRRLLGARFRQAHGDLREPQRPHVAVLQRPRAPSVEALAVDERAIARAEVAEHPTFFFAFSRPFDAGMGFREQRVVEHHIAAWISSDARRRFRQCPGEWRARGGFDFESAVGHGVATMLLVIDVGNTNTVFGVYADERSESARLTHHFRIETARQKTSDEYGILFLELLRARGIDPSRVKHAIVASVVPTLTQTFVRVCVDYCQVQPIVVGPGTKTGISILNENPKEVGADRIVNAVAAYEAAKSAVIVVDLGTATTFDVVSPKGEYLGGAIAPGIGISMEALFLRASKLPRVELVRPKTVIGKNTVHAMQAGIIIGYAGLVDELVRRTQAELGVKARVIATGGLAPLVAEEAKTIDAVDEMLTLKGLWLIWRRNA
jgi:type III pantothenate kinase